MLAIQKFLKLHPVNWESYLTRAPFNLKIAKEDGLVLFKYNQIESDFNNPIVRECRGLILEEGTWKVVACAFFKFFNYSESYADEIDWTSAKATLKLDGSLIKVFYYKDKWRVATNGTINAYNAITNDSLYVTFGSLFAKAAENVGLDFSRLNPNNTYVFELCSKFNKIVIQYNEPTLYHLTTRNNITLNEVEEDIGVQKPERYNAKDLKQVLNIVKDFDASKEGIVVCDKNGHRVKIKSNLYIHLHYLAGNGQKSIEKLVAIVRSNETSEFLQYFNEYTDIINVIIKTVDKLYTKLNAIEDYVQINWYDSFISDKEFATQVKDFEMKELYFVAKKQPLQDYFLKMTDRKFLIYLEKINGGPL